MQGSGLVHLTLAQCLQPGAIATKIVTLEGLQSFQAGGLFAFRRLSLTLAEIAESWASMDPRQYFVHGTPRAEVGRRRHKNGPELFDAPVDCIWIDVDKVDLPLSISPLDVASQAGYVRDQVLPAEFYGVQCVAGASASAGFRDDGKIRLRLLFALDVRVHISTVKEWLKASGAPIDLSLYIPSQPVYVAPPVLQPGVVDPFAGVARVGLLPGSARVRVPDSARGFAETLEAVIGGLGASIAPLSGEETWSRSNKLYGTAKDFGKLTPHHITHEWAADHLRELVEKRWPAYLDEYGPGKVEATIEAGLLAGGQEPRFLQVRKQAGIDCKQDDTELAQVFFSDIGEAVRYLPSQKAWIQRNAFGDWVRLTEKHKNVAPLLLFREWTQQRRAAAERRIQAQIASFSGDKEGSDKLDKQLESVKQRWGAMNARSKCSAVLDRLAQLPGCVADEVELTASVRDVTVLADGKVLLPIWKLRAIEPRFSADVDAWLRELAGAKYDKLENWIKAAPLTHTSVPALYFLGKAQAGKSVFADAMARLWQGEATTANGRKVFQKFNSDLERTPLVFCDEGLPKDPSGRRPDTTRFREMVEARAHAVERKGLDVTQIRGCLRIIIAENSAEGRSLRVEGGYEEHDIRAIEDRILAVPAGGTLSPELGARFAGTDEAVAHFVWLIVNRPLEGRGSRMIVEADAGSLVRRSALQHGAVADLYAHICDCLLDPARQWRDALTQSEPGVRVHEGAVLVNSPLIVEQWMQPGARPKRQHMVQNMRLICIPSNGYKRPWNPIFPNTTYRPQYRELDLQKLYEWAEREGEIDLEALGRAILTETAAK